MEFSEWVDLYMGAVLVMLVWRELLKERFESERDAKTLARKLEQEKQNRDWI